MTHNFGEVDMGNMGWIAILESQDGKWVIVYEHVSVHRCSKGVLSSRVPRSLPAEVPIAYVSVGECVNAPSS